MNDKNTRLTLIDEIRFSLTNDRWNEFVGRYDELLTKWLRHQNIPVADADDIKQRVLVTVVAELPKFEHSGNIGAFRSWLRRIMVNRLRELWRSRGKENQIEALNTLAEQLTDDRSHLTLAWDREHNKFLIQSMLKKARIRFGKKKVEMFEKVVLGEDNPESVANEFDVTLGSLRVTQHRILRELQEYGKGLIFE